MKKLSLYLVCCLCVLLCGCTPSQESIENERIDNNINTESESYIPHGALNRLFSVSSSKKVYFSKGNLQYELNGRKFRFANNQYDIQQSAVNLSGSNSVLDYLPYGASGAGSTRANSLSSLPTMDIAGTAYDWGLYNPIANAEDLAGFWRTLTVQEWEYLLHKRTNADSLNCIVTYNGITGLMLLPDDYQGAAFASLKFTNKTGDNYYYNNNYPRKKEYIENKLEYMAYENLVSLGAVFLPFNSSRTINDEPIEYYWTSTYSGSNQAHAILMQKSHLMESAQIITEQSGLSRVRLVQDYPIERFVMTFSKSPTTSHQAVLKGIDVNLTIGDKVYFAIYDKETRGVLNANEAAKAISKQTGELTSKWSISKVEGENILNIPEPDGISYQEQYLLGYAVADYVEDAKYKITYTVTDKNGKTLAKIEKIVPVSVRYPVIN